MLLNYLKPFLETNIKSLWGRFYGWRRVLNLVPLDALKSLVFMQCLTTEGLWVHDVIDADFVFYSDRLLSSKSLVHPPSLAHLDKVNSNSLDSCITIHDLPPKIPPYSKLQDLAGSRVPPRLTPSPAPVLHIDSPSCFSGQALSVSSSPILYPKMSGLHRSMESLPLHMSVPTKTDLGPREEARSTGTWGAGSRTSITLGDRWVWVCIMAVYVLTEQSRAKPWYTEKWMIEHVKKHNCHQYFFKDDGVLASMLYLFIYRN